MLGRGINTRRWKIENIWNTELVSQHNLFPGPIILFEYVPELIMLIVGNNEWYIKVPTFLLWKNIKYIVDSTTHNEESSPQFRNIPVKNFISAHYLDRNPIGVILVQHLVQTHGWLKPTASSQHQVPVFVPDLVCCLCGCLHVLPVSAWGFRQIIRFPPTPQMRVDFPDGVGGRGNERGETRWSCQWSCWWDSTQCRWGQWKRVLFAWWSGLRAQSTVMHPIKMFSWKD